MTEDHESRRKPFVRNHYLPSWMHRLANAVMAALLSGLLIFVWPSPKVGVFSLFALVVVLFIDPAKRSLVEGLAGDDGYVDLDDP